VRRAARIDNSQTEIVDAMRAMGASVWPIKLPVDLAVGFRGHTILVECKSLTETRTPRPKKYTKLQREFMAGWRGGPVATICDVDGAIRLLNAVGRQPVEMEGAM
jgi:hypothetical protein